MCEETLREVIDMKVDSLRFTHDPVADAAYIYVRYPIEFGEVVRSDVETPPMTSIIYDFDDEGRLLGIEILGASKLLPGEFF